MGSWGAGVGGRDQREGRTEGRKMWSGSRHVQNLGSSGGQTEEYSRHLGLTCLSHRHSASVPSGLCLAAQRWCRQGPRKERVGLGVSAGTSACLHTPRMPRTLLLSTWLSVASPKICVVSLGSKGSSWPVQTPPDWEALCLDSWAV